MDLKRDILDATRRLLISHGYEHLSMRRIAATIGVSATSIYHYFGSKAALFEMLVDEGMEQLYASLKAASDATKDPIEGVDALCRAYVRFGLENPEYYEIMFLLRPPEAVRFPAEKYRRARRNLDLLVELVERGTSLSPDEARVTASSIWATLHGVVSLIIARRIDVRILPEDVVDRTLGTMMIGFRMSPRFSAAN